MTTPLPPASVVRESSQPRVLTAVRETDAARAVILGLAQYLASLEINWFGRTVKFSTARVEWAEREDGDATYPSAVVMEDDMGATYSEVPMGGNGEGDDLPGAPGWELWMRREVKVSIRVEVMCTSPEERIAIGAMIEDAADPVEWMSGFRLVLPHYHGLHATYDFQWAASQDSQEDANQRLSAMVLRYVASVGVVQLRRAPLPLRPVVSVETEDTEGNVHQG